MKALALLPVALLLAAVSQSASAQVPITQTQSVTITVSQVDAFTVNTSSVTQSVGIGAQTFSGGTYTIQTNAPSTSARSITAQITAGLDFPTALGFAISLAAPSGATSAGAVLITAGSASSLVTSINNVENHSLAITLSTSATAQVDAGALAARTITYTLQ
jgi:hypothetical protein